MRTWSGIAVTPSGSVVRGRVLTAGGVSIARVDSPEPAPDGAEEALLEAASARTWRGGVEKEIEPGFAYAAAKRVPTVEELIDDIGRVDSSLPSIHDWHMPTGPEGMAVVRELASRLGLEVFECDGTEGHILRAAGHIGLADINVFAVIPRAEAEVRP